MKKAWLFCIAILFAGLCYVMAKPQFHVSSAEKETRIEKDRIKSLQESGLYDSAISYCTGLQKNDKLSYDDIEIALATTYYYKGDKHTAYDYIIKQTDYNWKVYTSDAFSDALSDFEYAYPIATDTFLEKIIVDKVRDLYQKQDFPEASAGFKLVLLRYQFQKCEAKYNYKSTHEKDSLQRQLLTRQFEEDHTGFLKKLLEIISDHGNFYTWNEAGNGYRFQYTFADEFKDSTLHAALKPYYEKAFRSGAIKQEAYVDELLLTTGIPQSDTVKLSTIRDSLCKIYKCRPLKPSVVVHYNNGDSMVMYDYEGEGGTIIKQNVK